MVGIYKLVNPNGKIYIGQSINIEKRQYQYNIMSRTSIGPKLFNSLDKYGYNNHQFNIIEECNIHELDEKELYWKICCIVDLGWEIVYFWSYMIKEEVLKVNILKIK